MTAIPQAVLSEHFQDRLKGRRLLSAVFTTFRFEPAFFETEVLPVFLDLPFSQATAIKLVQLEEALITRRIAVYYDRNGLVDGGGSAKLDVRRIPVRHPTGIFHPKNVFALVEATDEDENGEHPRALLCACLSANLTRAGWWENVEVGHVEEIGEHDRTLLAGPIRDCLNRLVSTVEGRRANDELRAQHSALNDIYAFLGSTDARERRSIDGRLLPHFDDGLQALPEFIQSATDKALRGMCLEVISPYFDTTEESAPLKALLAEFEPREVRVFLPKNDRGEALCSEELFAWVRRQRDVAWGTLPKEIMRNGKAPDAKHRPVHAKVYRFFEPKRGGREILYVGSTNLTQPGCRLTGRGGNWESGFLVEVTNGGTPAFWLTAEVRRPPAFAPETKDEGTAASGGSKLAVRYFWNRHQAEVFWNDPLASPALVVEQGGVAVFALADLPPRDWVALGPEASAHLERVLASTSLLHVRGEGPVPGLILVQEEEMFQRPSLLLDLSAADILKYWALLTVEQQAAFIEAHARVNGDDDPLLAKLAPLPHETTMFDRFAGFFLAFGCLEERVREALERDNTGEADYRLFGTRYDSLGNLLARVLSDSQSGKGDLIEHYVVLLCARQLLRGLGRDHPDYWVERGNDVKVLDLQLDESTRLRGRLSEGDDTMPAFLDWFDRWFLKRAEPIPDEVDA